MQAAWMILFVLIAGFLLVGLLLLRRKAVVQALFEPGSRLAERLRLRIAATLLDLGHHLMLCDEERRARRLQKKLSGRRARRIGLVAAALKTGAARVDEVTLEIPIGSREQEGNPSRTLDLSCVIHHTPRGESPPLEDDPCRLSWRVTNCPSQGYGGPALTVEIPSLERALISYHASPLRPVGGPAGGGSFFDEEPYHDTAVA